MMQQGTWDDLRFLLAIVRGQTLKAAARLLAVDETTVSRRLAKLQSGTGAQLVRRQGDAKLVLTEAGEAVARRAAAMEQQFLAIGATGHDDRDVARGTVRITSVPILINRLLAGAVGGLVSRHPGLVVELIPDSRDFNLTRREADLALRLSRPATGGMSVKARRIGALDYAPFASASIPLRQAQRLGWITYEEAMSHLPQARWIAAAVRGSSDSLSALRVHDAETALEATAAGLGRTLLPVLVAAADKRLRRLEPEGRRSYPSREIWLLVHADQLSLASTQAVVEWIEQLIGEARKRT